MGIRLECHVCVVRPTRTLLCTACSLHTGPYTELPSATIPSSFFTIADRSDVRILRTLEEGNKRTRSFITFHLPHYMYVRTYSSVYLRNTT